MIPVLYPPDSTTFTNMGYGPLFDTISCVVTEERNGMYELEMQYPVNGVNYGQIQERSIIMAIPSPYRTRQPFRVYEIEAPINGIVTVRAHHLSYDLSGVVVRPFTVTGVPATIMGTIEANAVNETPFQLFSNIPGTFEYEVKVPSTIRSLLGGGDDSVLALVGGEYDFDNFFQVRLKANRGRTTDVIVSYGRNLVDFNMVKSLGGQITGLFPYWTNGDDIQTLTQEVFVLDDAGALDYTYVIPLDLSSEFSEKPTKTELYDATFEYADNNGLWSQSPEVTMEVSFVDLAGTTEYEAVAQLETVDLCDSVTVYFSLYDINVLAKIVKIETNVLTEKYNSVTLGTIRTTIADTIASLETGTINVASGGGGSTGTLNYNDLINKPLINGVSLTGDKSLDDLGIQKKLTDVIIDCGSSTANVWGS